MKHTDHDVIRQTEWLNSVKVWCSHRLECRMVLEEGSEVWRVCVFVS